ncbi:MAG: branched-chain amino acid ABC transporter permease [Acidimicrobiales bacterium]
MDTVTIIVVDGLVFASWLFLISVGLSVIFGVLGVLNLAHGSLYAFGAFGAAVLVLNYLAGDAWPPGSFLMLVLGALIVGLLSGPVIERGLLRWIYGREQVLQLLATYALFLILEDVQRLIWGGRSLRPFVPYGLLGQFRLADILYPRYFLLLFGVAVASGLLLWLFLERSRFGRLVVAVAHDPEVSRAMGINLARVSVVTFTIGATLAALGGAFTAPTIAVVPGFAVDITVAAFAVVVIGGLGSVGGSALGALLVGLTRAGAVHLAPEFELFVIYLVMTLVLLVRPQGLFAREAVRRI